jgi:hypothetical protein
MTVKQELLESAFVAALAGKLCASCPANLRHDRFQTTNDHY